MPPPWYDGLLGVWRDYVASAPKEGLPPIAELIERYAALHALAFERSSTLATVGGQPFGRAIGDVDDVTLSIGAYPLGVFRVRADAGHPVRAVVVIERRRSLAFDISRKAKAATLAATVEDPLFQHAYAVKENEVGRAQSLLEEPLRRALLAADASYLTYASGEVSLSFTLALGRSQIEAALPRVHAAVTSVVLAAQWHAEDAPYR